MNDNNDIITNKIGNQIAFLAGTLKFILYMYIKCLGIKYIRFQRRIFDNSSQVIIKSCMHGNNSKWIIINV